MSDLNGKIAVVTGAAQGIGAATAGVLAEQGAAVVVNYLANTAKADAVVEGIVATGGRAVAVQGDVSTQAGIDRLFDGVVAAFGRVDILVNNAGPLEPAGLAEITAELIGRTVAANFTSVALCIRRAVELFPEAGGVVVNVSSETVRNILPGSAVFASVKAAGETLTQYLAQELGPRGIRVVGVSPGYTMTAATSALPVEITRSMVERTALRRAGDAADVASVIAFLASAQGAWITGTTISVSGGLNL